MRARRHSSHDHAPRPPLALLVPALALTLSLAANAGRSETHDLERPPSSSTSEAIGADPFEGSEEMIVSATRSPRTRSSLPAFTTVLEGDDLETSVSMGLADALRFTPGLQLSQDGSRGGRASLSLRGLDPNHVVVLIDGVRLNDPTNSRGGAFDPTTLALVEIERVEIIRGPLSSVYGSDALAGVVNVISRKAGPGDAATASVRGRGGRFHAGNVVAEASSGLGKVGGISAGASFDTFRDPNSGGSYDGFNWKSKGTAELPLSLDLEAFARMNLSTASSYPQSSGGPELAGLRKLEDRDVRELLFGLSLERAVGRHGVIDLRASRADRREDTDSPGIDPEPTNAANPNVVPPSKSGDEYERWDVSLISTWVLPEFELPMIDLRSRLVTGVDYVREDGESDTYLDFGAGFTRLPFFENRETVGFFAELEQGLGSYVVASASLRYDTTPDDRDRLSPSAGLTIDVPSTPLTLFGSYSEGYKRPSFYALRNPIVGNPDLNAEQSRGWEVGLRGSGLGGRLSGQLSYFDIEVENLIDFDNTGFVPRLVNRQELVSRGIELELTWQPLEWLRSRGGLTFNPTDFDGTSREPENRSRWRGFIELDLRPLPSIGASLRVLAVSSVKASSFHTGPRQITLAGYERIDVRLDWQPRDWIELFVEIENLSDRTYREAVGFESPGISPRAGASLRF